jgi:hypothetical protein
MVHPLCHGFIWPLDIASILTGYEARNGLLVGKKMFTLNRPTLAAYPGEHSVTRLEMYRAFQRFQDATISHKLCLDRDRAFDYLNHARLPSGASKISRISV